MMVDVLDSEALGSICSVELFIDSKYVEHISFLNEKYFKYSLSENHIQHLRINKLGVCF
jgi:hypothetical protein